MITMDNVKILEIKQSVFASNDREADEVRQQLKEKGVFLLNLMSSPGSGKTTTLRRTIEALKDEMRIGVMEADIDSTWTPRPLPRPVPRPSSCTPAVCAIWTPA